MKRALSLALIGTAAVLTALAIAIDPSVVESDEPRVKVPRPRVVAPHVRAGRWTKGGDA